MKNGRFVISILAIVIVIALFVVSVITFIYRADLQLGATITQDVKKLSQIFDRIAKTCGIASFDRDHNVINFLNVEKFTGSEVGPLNLSYPDKWEGPYLTDNLEVQGIEYMVVKTDRGYFITPGNGVKLPNGAVIGKDILLNRASDIKAMMADRHQLRYKNRPLAAQIEVKNSGVPAEIWRMKN